ncbi:MAG: Hpt domain-containing protein [Pseudobacteriovorax sp.]|nr:Hpt domain-containing protein [Pseudobacteriovorax sp.]
MQKLGAFPFLVALLFAPALAATSQNTFVIDKNFESQSMNSYLEILEDKEGQLIFEDVISSPALPWRKHDQSTPEFGYTDSVYWIKWSLSTTTVRRSDVYLEIAYPHHKYLDLFTVQQKTALKHQRSGKGLPFHSRDVNFKNTIFKLGGLESPQGVTTYYLRIESEAAMNLPLVLWSAPELANYRQNQMTFYGFYYGAVGIIMMYNLFLFLSAKKKFYLFYVLYILLYAGFQSSFEGNSYQFLWPNLPAWNAIAIPFFQGAAVFALYHFTQDFLRTRDFFRIMHFGINGLKLFAVATVLAAVFLPYSISIKMGVLSGFLTTVVLPLTGIVCWLRGWRPARFYVLAYGFFLCSLAAVILARFGLLPSSGVHIHYLNIGTLAEILLFSVALGDRIKTEQFQYERDILQLNNELQNESAKVKDLNETLEERVEEQTREIKSIMRHIHLGVVVVERETGKLTETYSNATTEIFGKDQVGGADPIDYLLGDARISREIKDQIATIIETSLGEDEVALEANTHLLPEEISIQSTEEKSLLFDWQAVVDNNDQIEKLIITVKDVTALKKLENKSKEQQEELQLIGEILSVSPRKFAQFMSSASSFLSDNTKLLRSNSRISTDILKLLFINLHTVKGAARALQLVHLTPLVHEVEQMIHDMQTGRVKADRKACLDEHQKIIEILDIYTQLNTEKLGRTVGDYASLPFSLVDRIHRSNEKTQKLLPVEPSLELQSINRKIEPLIFVGAQDLFTEILLDVEMLARDLDKEYPDIDINAHGVCFSQEGQKTLRSAFVHIIRNSMDHGIESATVREQFRKPAQGQIFVHLKEVEEGLEIRYGDDGQGLDLQAIRSIGVERKILQKDDPVDDEELANLVFHSGFSTAQSVSEISGRGVGMSAIREYFQKQGGDVNLKIDSQNTDGIPPGHVRFEIIMHLPDRFYIVRNQLEDVAA